MLVAGRAGERRVIVRRDLTCVICGADWGRAELSWCLVLCCWATLSHSVTQLISNLYAALTGCSLAALSSCDSSTTNPL